MKFTKAHILNLALFLSIFDGFSQRFSEDKTALRTHTFNKLKSIGTESAAMIAVDFQNSWDNKFTSQHQDKILEIALEMQKKGYSFYPYFYNYFAYLAHSMTQEHLRADQLEAVLTLNYKSVFDLSKSEYNEFLFGLNSFFEKRWLSHDKTFSVKALNGTYRFRLVGAQDGTGRDLQNTETVAPVEELETLSNPEEEGLATEDDQGWGTDDWGNDQGWDSVQDSPENTTDDWDNFRSNKAGTAYDLPKAQKPEPIQDYSAWKRSQHPQPLLEGQVIEIIAANLIIATPHDSLRVKNLNGNFTLKNRTLLATQGSVNWPERNGKFRGAVVHLSDFYLKKNHTDFWASNAKLQFGKLTGGGQVAGVFEYRSASGPKQKPGKYPIFTSSGADHKVRLNDERLNYIGGIQLRGNELFGKSMSGEPGSLKILDKQGNYILLRSKEFNLGDSLVSMNSGSITIVHGTDSIHHESVRAKYDFIKEEFKALRNSALTPFNSSYFDININIDLITWNMNTDSITLEIMNGKDLLPATFESEQFFSDIRYKKLGRFLSFHPINAAVLYALRYNLKAFYVTEMAMEYDINENFAKAAGKVLSQYGFADYNSETGYLKLRPRAFHYYHSSARKFDYDNLMIPSKIKEGANAYLQLDSGKINVKGVSRFFLTTDFKIYAEPKDSTVTILKGRDLEFDGMVRAGDFQFIGVKHRFNYDEFLFDLPHIDSIRLTVPLRDSTQSEEAFGITRLQNELTNTYGTLYIDSQDNKSGIVENSRYPYFNSDSESTVYFDGPEILNGAYDKSVKFIIPPFEVDSLDRKDGKSITFDGTFNSGEIFPTFPGTLHIQEDGSLGFIHQIPNEGYNLYGTEARTYEEIRLSNKG
ncbi:MAG: hypothetical protein OXH57_11335, partial [Ekhidna sp.]|nr:hypothetical protein [Ekhidna sp.]